ncbi:MAG: 1-phosphofructokinase [Dehalococcoidia bacterium]|nr:1-phosphofructokinase [Dehalococcoidia bacterium]
MMIVTLTMNPSVDKTVIVRNLSVGKVHRVMKSQISPAGKGINVSRMADRLGCAAIAFGFLAGEMGVLVERALREEGVQSHFVRVPGQTRLNVTVFDEAAASGTSFYDRGPRINKERLERLEVDLKPWIRGCKVLVISGSLPPGAADSSYADYVSLARSMGTKTILDADGEPMRLGVQAGPYLIKPNLAEMERLVGRALPSVSSIVDAAREVLAEGVQVVVVSMGAEGAIFAEGERVWRAMPPNVKRRSTVGSGDSMVAGLAVSIARGEEILEGLRWGTAAGAATAMVPGTALGTAARIHGLLPQVQLEPVP